MRFKKSNKRVVELSVMEAKLLRTALMHFRNKVLNAGKKIREFVIAIDTSGSVQGELVQKFLQKTYNIFLQEESFFKKFNVHIIQCDAEVQEDVKITNQKEFDEYINSMTLRGFGGTDFRPVFQYVDELRRNKEFINLKGLIYFTDGYGTFACVEMPEAKVEVEPGAFSDAENLKDMVYSKNGDILYFCPKAYTQSKIVVPEEVTELAPGVFYENEKIKDVYLSENVKNIGYCAFITWKDGCKINIHAPKNSYVEYFIENENEENLVFVANGEATTPYEPEDMGGNFDLSSLLGLFGLNG